MNSGTLSEEQMTEIIKMQRSLSRLVRLNRTLLLLSKIENGQFPETTEVNIAAIIRENIEIYSEIYADREISCTLQLPDGFKVSMNESLATTLISNLLKNSFVHNSNGGCVKVSIEGNTLTVANSGKEPLDASRIFERFYHKGNSDSTGLGLPLVSSIAERYGTKVEYSFADGMHCFSIKFMR
jgi:signal transduction histidine kinase